MPPQQHAQSAPARYDSPMPGYAPPLAQEPHQPVYGSGAAPMQGYTSTAPAPVERQPYYPPQQQPHQQGVPAQQQQYADAPGYGREPAYSSGPSGYAAPQGGFVDTPSASATRGGYSQPAPVSAPRHRSDEYAPAYSGRSQGYASQGRALSTAPVNHGGVGHDAGGVRAPPRGGSQAWAPSPREAAYVGAPHGSGMLQSLDCTWQCVQASVSHKGGCRLFPLEQEIVGSIAGSTAQQGVFWFFGFSPCCTIIRVPSDFGMLAQQHRTSCSPFATQNLSLALVLHG